MNKEEEALEDYKVTFMILIKAEDTNHALERARHSVNDGYETEVNIEHL